MSIDIDKGFDLGQWIVQWHRFIMGFAKKVDKQIDRDQAYWIVFGGIEKAYERFDPARGHQFSTYASWYMRQAAAHANTGLRVQKRTASVFSLDALETLDIDPLAIEPPRPDWDLDDRLESIRKAMRRLGARDRQILEMRYGLNGGEPMTLKQVGEVLGIHPERVRQLEVRAMGVIRKKLGVEKPAAA